MYKLTPRVALAAGIAAMVTLAAPTVAGARTGTSTQARQVSVSYHGLTVRIPSSWQVVNLQESPHSCVRFDVPALYLGHPGDQRDCPAHLAGPRTDAALLEPSSEAAVQNPESVIPVPAGSPLPVRLAPDPGRQAVVDIQSAGLLATVSYGETTNAVDRVLASATINRDAQPAPAVKATPKPLQPAAVPSTTYTGKGFDTCAAPSSSSMNTWKASSPYSAVGIYIGGPNRGCLQPNLTASWVNSQAANGWHMLPIYVGPYASGISASGGKAQGSSLADDAVTQAAALGFPAGSVIYIDVENYTDTSLRGRVLDYISGWSSEIRAKGYRAGAYVGGASGAKDLASVYGKSGYAMPDVIWTANWNGAADVSDSSMDLPSSNYWPDHQRVHQYANGSETYGGVTMNVDRDYLDVASDNTAQPPVHRDVATRVHGDFNGDGRDDVAAFYGYADGSVALHTFLATPTGGFASPIKSWTVGPGQWTFDNASFVAGDFNGDGRADLAAFYGYADTSAAMFTFLSNPDGTFTAPVQSWHVGPGNWYADHVQLASGDFNHDGRDEVAALYGYADGSAATFTFNTDSNGLFQAPVESWNVGMNQWWGDSSQLVSGDFNGDGRSDLAAFYGYADGRAAMFTFASNSDGTFQAPVESWNVGMNQWWGDNVQVQAGDFNGDGRTDVSAVYSYASGEVALFTFTADTTGGFAAPVESWDVPAGQWYTEHAQFVGGDFNGDGRAEVAAFYGYADGSAGMFTFNTNTNGTFQAPVESWNVGINQWWGDHVKLI